MEELYICPKRRFLPEGVVEGVTTPRLGTRLLSGKTGYLSQAKVFFTGGGRRGGRRGGHDPKIGKPSFLVEERDLRRQRRPSRPGGSSWGSRPQDWETQFLSGRTGSSSPTKAFSAGGGVVVGVATQRLGNPLLSVGRHRRNRILFRSVLCFFF